MYRYRSPVPEETTRLKAYNIIRTDTIKWNAANDNRPRGKL